MEFLSIVLQLIPRFSTQIGHYMKVPPRVTFVCQVVATVWACFVQIAVMNWTLDNIENVCTTCVIQILKVPLTR
jgi:hypothetical protein